MKRKPASQPATKVHKREKVSKQTPPLTTIVKALANTWAKDEEKFKSLVKKYANEYSVTEWAGIVLLFVNDSEKDIRVKHSRKRMVDLFNDAVTYQHFIDEAEYVEDYEEQVQAAAEAETETATETETHKYQTLSSHELHITGINDYIRIEPISEEAKATVKKYGHWWKIVKSTSFNAFTRKRPEYFIRSVPHREQGMPQPKRKRDRHSWEMYILRYETKDYAIVGSSKGSFNWKDHK